jgi:hypothetical protein
MTTVAWSGVQLMTFEELLLEFKEIAHTECLQFVTPYSRVFSL